MEVIAEFILDGYQYQELSNSSWNMPMTGHRRRELDSEGNAVSKWEPVTHNGYYAAAKLHSHKRSMTINKLGGK
jgi:hypothetical protein